MNYFENKWPAILLWPLSAVFYLLTTLRNAGYAVGLFKQYHLQVPVVSIGNLTVGGTGKTPTVVFIVQWLKKRGIRSCILIRGYGRKTKVPTVLLPHQTEPPNSEEVGDEPIMLARHLPDTPIIVDANRVRGGRLAQERFHPDILIMDDGWQHRRLYRDIDLITFRRSRPFGNGFLLPAGPLRESRRRLRRCQLFWFNGPSGRIPDLYSGIPVISADYQAVDLLDANGQSHPLPQAKTAVLAFCGLANPAGFKQTLNALGFLIKSFIGFADHHSYSREDLIHLQRCGEKEQVTFLVTTEKDWVKLAGRIPDSRLWRCLRIRISPDDPDQAEQLLERVFNLPLSS